MAETGKTETGKAEKITGVVLRAALIGLAAGAAAIFLVWMAWPILVFFVRCIWTRSC